MPEFFTLSCPSCGGRLEIKQGINRFACGYCGREHIVHKEGGSVSLEAVENNIHNIERSSNRVALEMTLSRLEKDIPQIEKELIKLNNQRKELLSITEYLKLQIKKGSNTGSTFLFLIIMSIVGGAMTGICTLFIYQELLSQKQSFFGLFFVIGSVLTFSILYLLVNKTEKERIAKVVNPEYQKANNELYRIDQIIISKEREKADAVNEISQIRNQLKTSQ